MVLSGFQGARNEMSALSFVAGSLIGAVHVRTFPSRRHVTNFLMTPGKKIV
jgi:hypothetical protein